MVCLVHGLVDGGLIGHSVGLSLPGVWAVGQSVNRIVIRSVTEAFGL